MNVRIIGNPGNPLTAEEEAVRSEVEKMVTLEREAREMWRESYPDAGLGIRKYGLVDLDVMTIGAVVGLAVVVVSASDLSAIVRLFIVFAELSFLVGFIWWRNKRSARRFKEAQAKLTAKRPDLAAILWPHRKSDA